jgi:hypothetical protein
MGCLPSPFPGQARRKEAPHAMRIRLLKREYSGEVEGMEARRRSDLGRSDSGDAMKLHTSVDTFGVLVRLESSTEGDAHDVKGRKGYKVNRPGFSGAPVT